MNCWTENNTLLGIQGQGAMMDEGSKGAMLWTDERITQAANKAMDDWLAGNIGVNRACKKQLLLLRAEYEATIATQAARIEQLERELNALAGWEPVEGKFGYVSPTDDRIDVDYPRPNSCIVMVGPNGDDGAAEPIMLPAHIRLCRRTGTGTQRGGSDE